MRGIFKLSILPFCIIFAAVSVIAAETAGDININIYASASQITIGDSLSLFCEITAPDDYKILEPFPEEQSPDYEIQKQHENPQTAETGYAAIKYSFLLYAFAPDTLRIGPFIAEYINADGESGNIRSGIIEIPVKSLVETIDSTPMPNRNPLAIKSIGISVWFVILILALFALIAAAILYYIRKKRKSPLPENFEPVDEIGEFLRLKDLKLYESGYLKELYVQISLKMRGFLNRNMEFDALNDTTGEIESELSKMYGNKKVIDEINKILKESDSVKYAKYMPADELSITVIDRALEPVKIILDEIALKEKEKEEALKSSGNKPDIMTENVTETSMEKNMEDE